MTAVPTDGAAKLNLGCGSKTVPGFLGVDRFQNEATDIVHDLEIFPWPFADNSIDYILMDNVLEHLADIVRTMEEIHRILKPRSLVQIIVPHATSTLAFADPTHKHYFTEESFYYFVKGFDYNYYSDARFEIASVKHIVNGRGIAKLRRYLPARRFLMKFFWNLCDAIDITLRKV